jgi:hypothetical protein
MGTGMTWWVCWTRAFGRGSFFFLETPDDVDYALTHDK